MRGGAVPPLHAMTMFQNNVKRIHDQNKAHTKISYGLQFCSLVSIRIYLFLRAYIFTIIFSKPKESFILAKTA